MLSEYEAHDRRIWAVDYSSLEHSNFASGSDVGVVKVRGLGGGFGQ